MRRSLRATGRCAIALIATLAATPLISCSDNGGPAANPGGNAGGSSGGTSQGAPDGGVTTSGMGGAGGAGGASGASGTSGSGGAPSAGGAAGSDAGPSSDASGSDAPSPRGDSGSDAGVPTLVPPIQRGNLHVFEFGDTTFAVDGTQGARITAFTMGGKNILTGPEVNARYWGSTFWTAPESDWMPNLVVPIDSGPYTMSVGADSTITAVGSTGTVGPKQVSVTKRFTADLGTSSVVIDYTMTNRGAADFQLGHWEVTRVAPGGLTFYPAGTTAPLSYGMIQVQRIGAYLWFNHAEFVAGPASKSYGDGTGGWVAHVVPDPAGDILLVKVFPDIPTGTAGAGHGEVEIFAAGDRSYVEVENHNRQVTIAPGQSSPWQVRWYLRRLPATAMRTAGNQALIDFVLSLIN